MAKRVAVNMADHHDLGIPWLDQIGTYLDNTYWLISAKRAGMVARQFGNGRGVPRHGYEQRIIREGRGYWLLRTRHQGRMVWALRAEGPVRGERRGATWPH